jgi:hypothetical protein
MTASAIFLDVEGVLAPSTLNWGDDDAAHYAGAPAPLSRCALERFTALVESLPGALVVISSDWRLDRESSLAALFSGLHATGLSLERVAGCTRDRPLPGANNRTSAGRRVGQIRDWLRHNEDEYGVGARWVAVDDLPLADASSFPPPSPPSNSSDNHFVRTSLSEGLTAGKCAELRRKLLQLRGEEEEEEGQEEKEKRGECGAGESLWWCLHEDCLASTECFESAEALGRHTKTDHGEDSDGDEEEEDDEEDDDEEEDSEEEYGGIRGGGAPANQQDQHQHHQQGQRQRPVVLEHQARRTCREHRRRKLACAAIDAVAASAGESPSPCTSRPLLQQQKES